MCECVEILSTLDQIEVDIEHIYHSNRSTLSVWDIRFFSDSLLPHHHRIIAKLSSHSAASLFHLYTNVVRFCIWFFSSSFEQKEKLAHPKATTRFVVVVAAPLLWPEREVIFSRKKKLFERAMYTTQRASAKTHWALVGERIEPKHSENQVSGSVPLTSTQAELSRERLFIHEKYKIVTIRRRLMRSTLASKSQLQSSECESKQQQQLKCFTHFHSSKPKETNEDDDNSVRKNLWMKIATSAPDRVCVNVFWRAHKTMWN